eukprot:378128_1
MGLLASRLHVSRYDTIGLECIDEDASKCPHLDRIVSNAYKCKQPAAEDKFDEIDLPQLLDDFLHLMDKHDGQFEWIHSAMKHCDIDKCEGFRRNYRDRNGQYEETHNGVDNHDNLKLEIMDRIHC